MKKEVDNIIPPSGAIESTASEHIDTDQERKERYDAVQN